MKEKEVFLICNCKPSKCQVPKQLLMFHNKLKYQQTEYLNIKKTPHHIYEFSRKTSNLYFHSWKATGSPEFKKQKQEALPLMIKVWRTNKVNTYQIPSFLYFIFSKYYFLFACLVFNLLGFFPPLFPPFFTEGSIASDHSPAMKLEVAFGGKVGHGVQYTVH